MHKLTWAQEILIVKCTLIVAVTATIAGCAYGPPATAEGDSRQSELQVIRVVAGRELPIPIPVVPGSKFSHGLHERYTKAEDDEVAEEFLVFFETEDAVGAAWFYEGVFWSRAGTRRPTGVTVDGSDPRRIIDFDAVAEGLISVSRYDLADQGLDVLVQVEQKRPQPGETSSMKKYQLVIAIGVLREGTS